MKPSLKDMDTFVKTTSKKDEKWKGGGTTLEKKQRTFYLSPAALKKVRLAYAETGKAMSDIVNELIVKHL